LDIANSHGLLLLVAFHPSSGDEDGNGRRKGLLHLPHLKRQQLNDLNLLVMMLVFDDVVDDANDIQRDVQQAQDHMKMNRMMAAVANRYCHGDNKEQERQ